MGSDDHKFTIRLPHDPDVGFETDAQLGAFLEREAAAWAAWKSTLEQMGVQRNPMPYLGWESIASEWAHLRDRADLSGDQKCSVANDKLSKRELIYSKSAVGNAILSMEKENPDFSAWLAIAYSSPRIIDSFHSSGHPQAGWFWSTLSRGLPELVQSVPARQRDAAAKKASQQAESHADAAAKSARFAQDIADAAERRIGEVMHRAVSVAGSVARQAHGRALSHLVTARTEWATLKRTYNLKMQTRAPYTYWRQKKINHGIVANAWMRTFKWALALGALGVSVGAGLLVAFGSFGPWPWMAPAVCLGVPAFVSLWIARLANRQYTANVLRAEDAGERAVMVRTLLALSEKSDRVAGDAEFLTMVSALFRPGPGLTTDDSPAVGALDAAVKALQGHADRSATR